MDPYYDYDKVHVKLKVFSVFIKFRKVSGKFPIKVSRKFLGGEDIEGGILGG